MCMEPYRMIRVRQNLDELIGMNGESNWMAVGGPCRGVYLSYRLSASVRYIPDRGDILSLYQANYDRLNSRPGTIVWASSNDTGRIILMRNIFNSSTMEFGRNDRWQRWKVSQYSIFFQNSYITGLETLLFVTLQEMWSVPLTRTGEENLNKREGSSDPRLIETEYSINNGKLKILHTVDLKERNQKYTDLLRLIIGIRMFVYVAIISVLMVYIWSYGAKHEGYVRKYKPDLTGEFELDCRCGFRMETNWISWRKTFHAWQCASTCRLMNQVVHDPGTEAEKWIQPSGNKIPWTAGSG